MNSQISNTNNLIHNLTAAEKCIDSDISEKEDVYSIIKSIKEIYGDEPTFVKNQIKRYLNLVKTFQKTYGQGEITILRAPARINIIGEHIDYIQYFQTRVFPFGSREYDMLMAIRKREDDFVRAKTTADGLDDKDFHIGEFLEKISKSEDIEKQWLEYLSRIGVPETSWDNYIKASAFYLQNTDPQKNLKGMDIFIDSTIPIAGGASSSSAMVVLSGMGFRIVNELEIDKDELADSSSKAEWYVGTRGGKMDHATICFAELSKALLITFEPFNAQPIPTPPTGYKWITFYTQPADKGSKVMSEYNERSVVSRLIIPALLEDIFTRKSELNQIWKNLLEAIETSNIDLLKESDEQIDLFNALDIAHAKALDIETGEYKTAKGELGFPNQMVRTLVSQNKMVIGLAMAHSREAKGVKVAEDIAIIENYLDDLR